MMMQVSAFHGAAKSIVATQNARLYGSRLKTLGARPCRPGLPGLRAKSSVKKMAPLATHSSEIQRPNTCRLLCWVSDAGRERLCQVGSGRRPKAAKEQTRGRWCFDPKATLNSQPARG
jgi:hypothetical protein